MLNKRQCPDRKSRRLCLTGEKESAVSQNESFHTYMLRKAHASLQNVTLIWPYHITHNDQNEKLPSFQILYIPLSPWFNYVHFLLHSKHGTRALTFKAHARGGGFLTPCTSRTQFSTMGIAACMLAPCKKWEISHYCAGGVLSPTGAQMDQILEHQSLHSSRY